MRGCLFTLLLAAAVVTLVVFLGLPALAAGVVTAGLTAAGLHADDTTVTVQASPPTDLLSGHADRVIVHATDATFRGLAIGSLDLALSAVDVLDRTAGQVDGTLTDVVLPEAAGGASLSTVTISGGGDRLLASTVVSKADVEALVADEVERRTGARPASVRLVAPDRLIVRAGGETIKGRFAAVGGDLVVGLTSGPGEGTDVVLLRGGEDLPLEIRAVEVTSDGALRIEGELAVGVLG
jgi:hypothetical protein